MQFHEINICQIIINRLYAVYNKMIKKKVIKPEKIPNIIASARIILVPTALNDPLRVITYGYSEVWPP